MKKEIQKLIGSEKQIKWANQIRSKVLPRIKGYVEMTEANRDNAPPELYDAAMRVLERVLNQASASWWIDSRDQNFDHSWLESAVGKEMK